MDIHQRASHGGVVIDQLGELLQLDGGGAQLLVLDDVLDLGKKAGVVITGEEVASTPKTSVMRRSTGTVSGRTSCSI